MKKELDFDDGDNSNEFDIKINEDYAKKFEHNHRRAELHQLQEKYGKDLDDLSESESSEDETEDEDGDLLTPDIDAALLKTLTLLKSKDPSIYSDRKIFDEEQQKLQDKADKLNVKRAKQSGKPMTLADFERQKLLKGSISDSEDDEEKEYPVLRTHTEEQKDLKDEVINAFHGGQDDDDDDLLKPKTEQDDEDYQNRDNYRKFLIDNIGEDEIRKALGLDGEQIANNQQEQLQQQNDNTKIKSDNKIKKKSKPSKQEQRSKDDAFLMDYILNQGWVGGSSTTVPKDDFVSNDIAALGDSQKDLPTFSGANANNELVEDDEDWEEEADDFETKYNFRFEEPDADQIKTHSRQLESTVRRSDNKRKEQRERKKERKEKEKQQREEEVKRLKSLRKQELNEKLKILGNDAVKFENLDLDAEFNPEAHDKAMRDAYENDDEYDPEFGEEKPEWEDDINIDDIVEAEDNEPDPDNMDADYINGEDDSKITMSKRERKKAKKKAKLEAKNGDKYDDEEDINMDADQLPQQDEINEEDIPKTAEERRAKLEEWLDDYYKLDYEDVIGGDLKTRFKYTKVVPDNYGLDTEEILRADDKDLKRMMRVKRMAPYRKDKIANSGKGKYVPGMQDRIMIFKQKVRHDRPEWGEAPEQFEQRKSQGSYNNRNKRNDNNGDDDQQPPAKKKRLGKKERQKLQNQEK